ncbi:hypothetical protein A3A76_02005 [Candidatus Woesebacteria bacterium RIFCSPLOWO2_01_FULL_39_23]|uniref:Single-stranded DNA-binding protein n=1 Tax=Candidatus Woesebacteria bacterium RIFCSPHIGHO2_01_FULL_40_22 TaxID=1802499 RepID=A0A1F7YFY4_9BACT|nr:MAG: hypothetical protein A2141_03150 [Candidatus Woesebacteria bacterium RBG_16_40_11]OGM26172.1 MAG: hypothetical protein A2628_02435 [Candidatus Woesebacteria bacterium RIFCSPHIGHO2_01_FULL_40_22]OGM62331.1 MAG: hypothetical protein A3A76_02005 [Candidatus Woesebacteria bacterium RIFCSPLOWO2_01_FULL_39_23]
MIKVSLQIVSIIGNATKDAELRVSKDGVSYLTFRVAVSGQEGTATFYNILVFGHYGEAIKDQVTRGRQIYVTGRLQISEKGYISVVADHLELLARPKQKLVTETEVEVEKKPEVKVEKKNGK